MATIGYDTLHLRKAFEVALDSLGSPAKNALAYHLESVYGISLATGENFTQEKVITALQELLGNTGAEIIARMAEKYIPHTG